MWTAFDNVDLDKQYRNAAYQLQLNPVLSYCGSVNKLIIRLSSRQQTNYNPECCGIRKAR